MKSEVEVPQVAPQAESIRSLRDERTLELRRFNTFETAAVGAELEAQFYERSAARIDRDIVHSQARLDGLRETHRSGEVSEEEDRLVSLIRAAAINRAQAAEKLARAIELRRSAEHHQRNGERLTLSIQRKTMSWLFDAKAG